MNIRRDNGCFFGLIRQPNTGDMACLHCAFLEGGCWFDTIQIDTPWLLAGGLTLDNVAEALKISGARGVDLSSGVESAPGVKDEGLIRSFIHAVRSV